MATLSWTTTVQVSGGPTIKVSREPKAVEAYDYVAVELRENEDVTVDLQPGGAADITMMLVKSSYYGQQLTFVVSDGTKDTEAVALDEPQMFAGDAVTLLGPDPKALKLKLAKSSTEDSPVTEATVEIFVFRDAISR